MRRRPRLPELGAAAVAVGALAGCGGGGNVLSDSSKALDGVHSGVLRLKVLVEPSGGAGKNPFGFELTGPFRLGARPVARMRYTQIANGHTGVATIVLQPSGGYVESNGRRHDLTARELRQLRGATRQAASGGGLQLADWATSTHRRSCGDAICVDGRLDPAKAVAGLTQLEQSIGSAGPRVKSSPQLRRAVRESSYRLEARNRDKLPRLLSMTIDFHEAVPAKLQRTLGPYVGAKLTFRFGLEQPNENVHLG